MQVLIAEREAEEAEPIPAREEREVIEERKEGGATLRLEYVRCGKENCRCMRGKGPGPYWYTYFCMGDKVRSNYLRKKTWGRPYYSLVVENRPSRG